jgi:hypothetical protein
MKRILIFIVTGMIAMQSLALNLPPDSLHPNDLELPLMKGNIPVIKHLG